MKVLIYGAGVLGSFLAHVLCQCGQDVTMLARGTWRDILERDGLVIRHHLQRKITVDHIRVIGDVSEDSSWDVIFAVMQHQQMNQILEDLARADCPLLVLVGNNMSAPAMEAYIHSHSDMPKTILFGFQGTGGRREAGQVVCVRWGGGSMTIGGLHGQMPQTVQEGIGALFAGSRYRLTWMPDMDAWYKCHLALILPVAYLCYTTGCDLRRATRSQRKQVLDAADEGYRLLAALGCPILPPGEERYYRPGGKRRVMEVMMLAMAKTALGDLAASDHCRHAVTEMEGLDRAWRELRSQKKELPMPNWESLRAAMPAWDKLYMQYERENGTKHRNEGEGWSS